MRTPGASWGIDMAHDCHRWLSATVTSALASLVLLTTPAPAVPPPNDDCTAATPITTTPFTDTVDATDATTEPTDPTAPCSCGNHSVWYSLAPTQSVNVTVNLKVFGNVHIGIGESMTIDARGGAVIQMDSLRMEAARQTLFDVDPLVRWCDSGNDDAVAKLTVRSHDGDQVVINVGNVTLGTCAQPDMKDGVINVPGPGGPIHVGTQVGYAYSASPVLLAPERKVSIFGSAIDTPPIFSAIYARSLKTTGFVLIENQWGDDLPCHPY